MNEDKSLAQFFFLLLPFCYVLPNHDRLYDALATVKLVLERYAQARQRIVYRLYEDVVERNIMETLL